MSEDFSKRGLGFQLPKRWPTREEMIAHSSRMLQVRAVAGALAPTKLGTPTILDQGNAGACTGFASVQGIHIYRQVTGQASSILSPVVPYWAARREVLADDSEMDDTGADPDSVVKALSDFGAAPFEDGAYSDADVNSKPGAVAFDAAQQVLCRVTPILESGSSLFPVMQHALSVERLPVMIAIEVCPGFDRVGPDGLVTDTSGTSRGLHANLCYGWDDNGAIDANSWGTLWGRSGSCTLSPDYLAAHCVWAGTLEVLP